MVTNVSSFVTRTRNATGPTVSTSSSSPSPGEVMRSPTLNLSGGGGGGGARTPRPGAPLTALVVEDTEIVRDILLHRLRQAGLDAVETSCGADALGELTRRRFDIVFCDMHMPPGFDGLETVRRLREFEAAHRGSEPAQPVFLLTAHSDDADLIQRGRGLVHGVLDKLTNIERLVQLAQQQRDRAVGSSSVPSAYSPTLGAARGVISPGGGRAAGALRLKPLGVGPATLQCGVAIVPSPKSAQAAVATTTPSQVGGRPRRHKPTPPSRPSPREAAASGSVMNLIQEELGAPGFQRAEGGAQASPPPQQQQQQHDMCKLPPDDSLLVRRPPGEQRPSLHDQKRSGMSDSLMNLIEEEIADGSGLARSQSSPGMSAIAE